ncbi:MAG: GspE/PulE family protein [Actinomycetota bacterium]
MQLDVEDLDPLAFLLVQRGLLSPEHLQDIADMQRQEDVAVSRLLVERGFISEDALVHVLASELGIDYVELSQMHLDKSAVSLIDESAARRYTCIPIRFDGPYLILAMADPMDVVAVDDIRALTRRDIKVVTAARSEILNAIGRSYRVTGAAESLALEAAGSTTVQEQDLQAVLDTSSSNAAPIIRLVNMLISQAVSDRASDIHIEPEDDLVRVRYRIDGVLHEIMTPPKNLQSGITSRLKIMADVDIAERRNPQDGRISLKVDGKPIDIRLATLPSVHGEKIVMRLLDKSSVLLDLSELSFSAPNLERFRSSYTKPYGQVLVTGPTGSGKSTTLYATLNILNKPDVNIITVEDPVEYRLRGTTQVQTNSKGGLTFASALRSVLRSDPDIVLIGEIRDRETAQIATEAALTGHLVLSTLHTNDAPSAMTRLVEMGIEPYLVSSALDCVLAQRLARRLCDKCKEAYQPTEQEMIGARFPVHDGHIPELFKAVGCGACGNTGYKGRMALHEVMPISEEIEVLCVERASSEVIKKVAVEQGMLTLRDDGMEKVRAGQTSIQEILRVVV